MENIKHIGIIMDGNRRWAKDKGLPSIEGHRKGYDKLKEVGEWCLQKGIKYVTVYAFSTENWSREKSEVDYLMKLLKKAVTSEIPYFMEKNIRLRVVGSRKELSDDLIEAIEKAEEETKNNDGANLSLAINYGGRLEILEAAKKLAEQNKDFTEENFSQNVWTSDIPDPEIVIRTSGEQRLSGFLTWQSVYSELFFVQNHWPAFSKDDFEGVLEEFNQRNRRFGGN